MEESSSEYIFANKAPTTGVLELPGLYENATDGIISCSDSF